MPATAARPRVAYLYSRYPVVSQTFCDSEMLALEQMGFDLEVASLNRPPNSFRHERLDRLRAEIHYPPETSLLDALAEDPGFKSALGEMIKRHGDEYGTTYKPQTRARNAWYFARLFRRLGVQHVHVHFANRATHTALFLKRLGFPFSFTAHAQDFMFDLGCNALLSEMAREAEFIVAVSDYSRELLKEMCPESADKITRIYNGIELDDFAALPSRACRAEEPLRILSVGRLIEFKGFRYLIEACADLKRQGIDFEARIIGEGPLRAELAERIGKLGLQDCVRLLGVRSQEEVKRELREADVFVLASIFDNVGASDILPTVITEAMACSLPVVSTRVAGIPEMVAQGKTGLLVEPADAPALANAIQQLAGDARVRQRMGEAGSKRARSLFALEITAGGLAEKFSALPAPAATARAEAPVVYFVREWNGKALLRDGPGGDQGVRWLAGQARLGAEEPDRESMEQIEVLPDACVIESIWLRRPQARQQVEQCRATTGEAVSSTEFYLAARHAVYLAEVLPKRGARHLHAWRSDSVLTVWLARRLLPGLRVSCAIEEEPAAPRGMLARLAPDFDLVSVSDPKLRGQLGKGHADELQLHAPFRHEETRVGPVKIKRRKAAAPQDRPAIERAWLEKIRKSIA